MNLAVSIDLSEFVPKGNLDCLVGNWLKAVHSDNPFFSLFLSFCCSVWFGMVSAILWWGWGRGIGIHVCLFVLLLFWFLCVFLVCLLLCFLFVCLFLFVLGGCWFCLCVCWRGVFVFSGDALFILFGWWLSVFDLISELLLPPSP